MSTVLKFLVDVGVGKILVVERPYFHIFISPQTLDHLTFATPLPDEPADWTEAVASALSAVEKGA